MIQPGDEITIAAPCLPVIYFIHFYLRCLFTIISKLISNSKSNFKLIFEIVMKIMIIFQNSFIDYNYPNLLF